MLVDLRQAGEAVEHDYDLCIAGAGAAGIALAMEFVGKRTRVCLLESGGLDIDPDTQDLYRGEVVGLQYADLDTHRLRFFGGTTNHWAGYSTPFPDFSFEPHAWIPHSGWPLRRAELTPYYQRAHDRLDMEDVGWDPGGDWDAAAIGGGAPGLAIDPAFRDKAAVIRPVRMGETFRETLAAAENVDVVLYANLVEIQVNETARTVTGFDVRTLDGRRALIRARIYVVASGGIENARLLLNSDRVQAEGLGNGRGLVGRFFSDHAHFSAGYIQTADRGVRAQLYDRRPYGRDSEKIFRKDLTFEAMREHELTLAGLQLRRHGLETPAGNALRQVVRAAQRGDLPHDLGGHIGKVLADLDGLTAYTAEHLWYGQAPVDRIHVEFLIEPAPNPDSRVTLGDEVDPLGLRRVRLDWRLSEIDERTFRWMADRLVAGLAENGIGRMKFEFDWADYPDMIVWDNHNISTTRMASDPAEGVVDADCRVHGIDNLYMGGSSVFATCGGGSPTLMIVALAIRLGDHLKTRGLT
jgi:choline dehydrogenase-like flavoprotein